MTYFTDAFIQRIAPRPKGGAALANWTFYTNGLKQSDAYFKRAGVNSRLRLVHLLAQWLHECDRFTILYEDMQHYSANRIMQIFGVGRHSAKITLAEAQQLSGDGEGLAERVYGLGNPRKARELGNIKPGDGYAFRGWSVQQLTGRGDHQKMADRLGVSIEEMHSDPVCAIRSSLEEWIDKGCNLLADRDDVGTITRRINGGFNGFDERKSYVAKLKRVILADPVWEETVPAPAVPKTKSVKEEPTMSRDEQAQQRLSALGYHLGAPDGRVDVLVRTAILSFQDVNGLTKTGDLDDVTFEILMSNKAKAFPVPPERQNITAKDLHDAGSATVKDAWSFRKWLRGIWVTIMGLLGIEASGGSSYVDNFIQAADKLRTVREHLPEAPDKLPLPDVPTVKVVTFSLSHGQVAMAGIAITALTVGSLLAWRYAKRTEARRVAEARNGDNRSK